MKRILASLVVALVTAVGLFWPLLQALDTSGSATSPDPVTITDYHAVYTIAADGRLDAAETITAEFPYGRHGIFRFWDTADSANSGIRYVPKGIGVSRDGQGEKAALSWEKGKRFRVAKIGDADNYVSEGSHVYRIKYHIAGALAPTNTANGKDTSSSWAGKKKGHSLFAWQVVAPGWQMDIAKSNVQINLPAPTNDVHCASTTRSSSFPCKVTGLGTKSITVTTEALPPRTPVSVLIDIPTKAPHRHTLPWPVAFDNIYGRSLTLAGLLLALSVVGLLVGYFWERRTREEPPGFPVMYEPPAMLGPVQTAFVTDERLPGKALVSTLLYQAEQGLTTLTDLGDNHWNIVGKGTPEQWAKTDDVTRAVGLSLGLMNVGGTFAADGSVSSGQTLHSLQASLNGTVKGWAS
ncbi:MAG: DUF2207 domain-containing protein, partial [Aeromicrobium sp.]